MKFTRLAFNNYMFFCLIVSLNLMQAVDFSSFNSSYNAITDLDIIGAYRTMTGTPISDKKFAKIKFFVNSLNWKFTDLGKYLFSLNKSKSFLNINWGVPVFDLNTPYNEHLCKLYSSEFQAKYLHLNLANTLLDEDIVSSYRVLTGRMITEKEFLFYRSLGKGFKPFITIMLGHDDSMANLNIPILRLAEAYSLKLKNNMTLFGYKTDVVIAHTIDKTGNWEPQIESLIRKVVTKGNFAIDIGANIGYHTATLSELVGKNGKVYAFEPVPQLVNLLNKSKTFNNWDQVIIKPYALSNKFGQAFIKENSICPGWAHFISEEQAEVLNNLRPGSAIKIETRMLDDVFIKDEIRRLDFIKIDVEGAEWDVLQGSINLIKKFKPKIIWEFNPDSYSDPIAVLKFFENLGYKLGVVNELYTFQDPLNKLKQKSYKASEILDLMKNSNINQIDIFLAFI